MQPNQCANRSMTKNSLEIRIIALPESFSRAENKDDSWATLLVFREILKTSVTLPHEESYSDWKKLKSVLNDISHEPFTVNDIWLRTLIFCSFETMVMHLCRSAIGFVNINVCCSYIRNLKKRYHDWSLWAWNTIVIRNEERLVYYNVNR